MHKRQIFMMILTLCFMNLCFSLASVQEKTVSKKATLQGLGDLPGGAFESIAKGISFDGSIVVGMGKTENGDQAFRWTEVGGMVSLGNLSDSSFNQSWANGISGNGEVIVGSGDPGQSWNTHKGFVWTAETGMTLIGSLNGSERYEAFAASADGSIITGDGGQQIFRWTEETGCTGLGTLAGRNASRGVDISDDGSVIVGSSYNLPNWDSEQAYRWTAEEGIVGIGFLPGSNYSFSIAVSNDGKVVVGTGYASGKYPAFRWTQESGMVNIGHLPGKSTTHPQDLTADGSIIVGASFGDRGANSLAFIWDETNGMRNFQTVLQDEYGLDLSGWTIEMASGITPNGDVIIGWGKNPAGNQEAFRVALESVNSQTQGNKRIKNFELGQNYPNPFNPSTTIPYSLQKTGFVSLSVFNCYGQCIQLLEDAYQTSGCYIRKWDGKDSTGNLVSSGIYLVQLTANDQVLQKKIMLVR